MEIELAYGRGRLRVALPPGARPTVISKRAMPTLADPEGCVARALDGPAEGPALADAARGARSACVLVCDVTRPVPNGLILRPIVERLLGAGVPRDAITVLVATGLHRANVGAELEELIADPWVLDAVAVHNHDARDDAAHVHLGATSRGTVVRLDRRLVEADLRIATGLVEPHFMAGYSGGRKVIAPGVAHAETITTFHNHRFMAHPRAVNCVLEGNPLHEEQLAIVAMLGGALAVNTVIDEARRLAFVNFGEVVASHLRAVEFVRRYAEVAVTRRFRTVVTSAAGHPLDKTYYQTVKGMVGPLDILEREGDLIVAAECSEGLGSAAYRDAQRRLVAEGVDGFLAAIRAKAHADVDEWQTQMQVKPLRRGRVHLYSEGLPPGDWDLTGVALTGSLEATIAASLARHRDSHLAVVPEGPYVIPRYQESVS